MSRLPSFFTALPENTGWHDDDLSGKIKAADQSRRKKCDNVKRQSVGKSESGKMVDHAAALLFGKALSMQREYSNRLYRRANVLDGGFYPNRDRGQSCAGENRDKEHDRKLRS